ncbi:unnamed protein product [Orchesella dallaii]|uniref:Uncharacterized protein n=1 Tax=Orchesella dallaii TaxID=48710 RepID=A0ABP1R0C4_9HEXA
MWTTKVKAGLSAIKAKYQKETGESKGWKGKVVKEIVKIVLVCVVFLAALLIGAVANYLIDDDEKMNSAMLLYLGYDYKTLDGIEMAFHELDHKSPAPNDEFPSANFSPGSKPDREFWESIKPTVFFSKDQLDKIKFGGGNKVGRMFYSPNNKRKVTSDNTPGCLGFTYGWKGNKNNSLAIAEVFSGSCNLLVFSFSMVDKPLKDISYIDPQNMNIRIIFTDSSMYKREDALEHFLKLLGQHWIDVAEVEMGMNTIVKVEEILGLVPQVGQLIFKFRCFEGMEEEIAGKVLNVLDQVQRNGFRLFHTNSSCINDTDDCIFEYSFLNLNSWSQLLLIEDTPQYTKLL